jgi:hypothetical protein
LVSLIPTDSDESPRYSSTSARSVAPDRRRRTRYLGPVRRPGQTPQDSVFFLTDREGQVDLALFGPAGKAGFYFILAGSGHLITIQRPGNGLDYARFAGAVGTDNPDHPIRENQPGALDHPEIRYVQ